MIQQVAGMNQVGNDPKFHFNTFRFNDVSTTTDMLDVRRTMPVKGFGNRSTLNVRVPMTKSSIFSVMPCVLAPTCVAVLRALSHALPPISWVMSALLPPPPPAHYLTPAFPLFTLSYFADTK
jgi:hypothetical protein